MKDNKMSSYRHVLKERDHRSDADDEKNRRRNDASDEKGRRRDKDRDRDSKHASRPHKRGRSHSPSRNHHHKKSPLKSKVGYDNLDHQKSRKQDTGESNESYEELSRRKRRLESELRALDMEEAAEREAENKKARKERSKHQKEKHISESKSLSHSDNERFGNKKKDLYKESRISKSDNEKSNKKKRSSHKESRSSSKSDNERPQDRKKESRKQSRSSSRSDNERPRDRKKESRKRSRSSSRSGNERSRERKKESKVQSRSASQSDDDDTWHYKSKAQNVVVKVEKEDNEVRASKSSGDEWGKPQKESKEPKKEKEKPNLAVSGKLAEETNTYNGIVIKYNEPPEARKPKRKWRLYPFKGESDLPFIPIHRQSAYLFGRTRLIADIPIDHPSCSKQHAVLQYRLVPYKREDGTTGRRVRPYIIDLESSNGTYVNNKKIDPRCYVELIEKDVIKFGYSSREYVILHEESKNEEEDDDVLELNSENSD